MSKAKKQKSLDEIVARVFERMRTRAGVNTRKRVEVEKMITRIRILREMHECVMRISRYEARKIQDKASYLNYKDGTGRKLDAIQLDGDRFGHEFYLPKYSYINSKN